MINEVIDSNFDYDIEPIYLNEDMSNKLFCTFATEETLDSILKEVQERYKIIYNKIFVLYSKSQDEYICTYNVDFGNIGTFLDNTILVHRKKVLGSLWATRGSTRITYGIIKIKNFALARSRSLPRGVLHLICY